MNAIWSIWLNYFWSSDKGNGPEAIQQTVFYALVAVVFVPVVRKWVKAELKKVHEKLDAAHAKLDLAHAKMDTIMEHRGVAAKLPSAEG